MRDTRPPQTRSSPGNETKMVGSLGLCVAELTERVKEVLFADVCGQTGVVSDGSGHRRAHLQKGRRSADNLASGRGGGGYM